MPTDETGRVARAYHDAWTNRKGPEALRELMAEEFVFDSAMMHIEGRDQFLAGAGASGWPEQAVTTLLAEAYDGEHAFQLYTGSNGGKTSRSQSISSYGTDGLHPVRSSSTVPHSWHS